MPRGPYFIRDPVEREKVADYLRHKLKILDARLRLMRLTAEQLNLYHGEWAATFNTLFALCGESFQRDRENAPEWK